MNIKLYIVTYNNSIELDKTLNSIFDSLSKEELNILDLNVINNHANFKIDEKFKNKVKILHNNLRPDFSTGHLSRNWNQAIINGFKNLQNPDADIVITCQDDTRFQKNFVDNIVEYHKNLDFITFGYGDNFVSYTPNAIKKIGLWDERFCGIGYQEGDYFLRAYLYHKKYISINDPTHGRIFNPIKNNILSHYSSGNARGEQYHRDAKRYHSHNKRIFLKKWAIEPERWNLEKLKDLKPLFPSFFYYPYFEKDIDFKTLINGNYIVENYGKFK